MSCMSIVGYLIFIFFLEIFSLVEYLINWDFFGMLDCKIYFLFSNHLIISRISLLVLKCSYFQFFILFVLEIFKELQISDFILFNLLSLLSNFLKLRLESFLLFFPFISVIILKKLISSQYFAIDLKYWSVVVVVKKLLANLSSTFLLINLASSFSKNSFTLTIYTFFCKVAKSLPYLEVRADHSGYHYKRNWLFG